MVEGLYPVAGEELERDELADVAPVRAVRREGEGGVVVGQVLADGDARAVGEEPVVRGEALLDGLPAAEHEDSVPAEPERVDGAVLVGPGAED